MDPISPEHAGSGCDVAREHACMHTYEQACIQKHHTSITPIDSYGTSPGTQMQYTRDMDHLHKRHARDGVYSIRHTTHHNTTHTHTHTHTQQILQRQAMRKLPKSCTSSRSWNAS
jgi:hypothetical protein